MLHLELIPRLDGEKARGGLGRAFQKPSPIHHKAYQHYPSERLTNRELSLLPRGDGRDAIVKDILSRRADHRGAETSLLVAINKLKKYQSWLRSSKHPVKRWEYGKKIEEAETEVASAKQEVLRTNDLLGLSDRATHTFSHTD